jgi:hypothetical protein
MQLFNTVQMECQNCWPLKKSFSALVYHTLPPEDQNIVARMNIARIVPEISLDNG